MAQRQWRKAVGNKQSVNREKAENVPDLQQNYRQDSAMCEEDKEKYNGRADLDASDEESRF